MVKVLIADEISKEGIAILESALAVDYQPHITPEELIDIIGQYDAVLIRSRVRVTRAVILNGKRLKVIGRAGAGVDNIDLQAATEAGILVVNSPEGNTASAAEHALALMLSLSRMVPSADASVKLGKWERNRFLGSELFNKTLGIIGLGKVGTRVARVAQAIGMKVIAFDPLISPDKAKDLDVSSVSLEEIWKHSDFISVHVPKTRETIGLIDETVLTKVKAGVRIINTARGGIVKEEALVKAIKDGRVAGAALDVFESEPLKQSELIGLKDKVILTPHIGASTQEAQFNVAIDLAEQLKNYLTGGHVRSPVNLPVMNIDTLKSLGKYVWLAEAMGAVAGELVAAFVKDIEIKVCGALAHKDTGLLAIASLKGLFTSKVENVTYVNAHLIARNHGIQVKETKSEYFQGQRDEITITVSNEAESVTISGSVLSFDELVITKINDFHINLAPQRYMLFIKHQDQPGMVAKVASILGNFDINISTMSVARRNVRQDAVMVMSLDDPLPKELVAELSQVPGVYMVRFVTLNYAS